LIGYSFIDTLQRLGWTDGRNVRIEYRWGAGDTERAKTAAAELVRSAPDEADASWRLPSDANHENAL